MNINHGKNTGPNHEPEGRGALVGAQSGPTVLRIALGAQLRKYREASGLTTAEAAEVIRATHSKISRLERGRTTARQRDVADLLTLYGVTDEAERDKLLELTREASVPGWWQQYNDILPRWLELYIGLEKAASIIRSYEMQFIHGLLQTEDYARAVILISNANAPTEEIETITPRTTPTNTVARPIVASSTRSMRARSRASASSPWTWGRSSPGPSTAASSRSGSRRC